jgi:hypothetical protein
MAALLVALFVLLGFGIEVYFAFFGKSNQSAERDNAERLTRLRPINETDSSFGQTSDTTNSAPQVVPYRSAVPIQPFGTNVASWPASAQSRQLPAGNRTANTTGAVDITSPSTPPAAEQPASANASPADAEASKKKIQELEAKVNSLLQSQQTSGASNQSSPEVATPAEPTRGMNAGDKAFSSNGTNDMFTNKLDPRANSSPSQAPQAPQAGEPPTLPRWMPPPPPPGYPPPRGWPNGMPGNPSARPGELGYLPPPGPGAGANFPPNGLRPGDPGYGPPAGQ